MRDAMKDDNTVAFIAKHQPAFEAIKQAFEQQMHVIRSGRMQQLMQQPVPIDIPGQIQKLAELKNQRILAEQEFQHRARIIITFIAGIESCFLLLEKSLAKRCLYESNR
jgi:hypothetical protein